MARNGSYLLLLALSAALAVGCWGCRRERPAPRPGEPVTVVFRHAKHPRYTAVTELIKQFEAENPDIRIREELLPASTDEQHQFYVMNLAAGADDVDVIDMDVIWVPEFARAGWLAELTPHIPKEELAPLNASALRADWLDGKLWGVPWFVDAGVLYFRRDLLEKYGFAPPRTYEELAQQARHILNGEADPRLAGFVWQGMQYEGLVCAALEFIRGNGGDVLDDQGHPALTRPETVAALHFMYGLIRDAGITPPLVTTLNEEAARFMFQSGRAIFMRNWPYAWRLLNREDSPVAGRVGLTMVPHFTGGRSAPTLGGWHLGINARSPHKSEAVRFIRFMIRYASQRQVLLDVGVLAAHMELYRDPEIRAQMEILEHLLPSLEATEPRPVTPYYLMISQILQPELSAVVAGIRRPERAMEIAEPQVAHLLGVE